MNTILAATEGGRRSARFIDVPVRLDHVGGARRAAAPRPDPRRPTWTCSATVTLLSCTRPTPSHRRGPDADAADMGVDGPASHRRIRQAPPRVQARPPTARRPHHPVAPASEPLGLDAQGPLGLRRPPGPGRTPSTSTRPRLCCWRSAPTRSGRGAHGKCLRPADRSRLGRRGSPRSLPDAAKVRRRAIAEGIRAATIRR